VNQRVHDPVPARHRVEHEAHATEVDLQLIAPARRRHPHRLSPPPPPAEGLGDVALHRPARHLHPAPLQQLRDLHSGQIALNPSRDLIVVGPQQPPRPTVPVGAVRARDPPKRGGIPYEEW
jgi:hypothetical protein